MTFLIDVKDIFKVCCWTAVSCNMLKYLQWHFVFNFLEL